MPSIDLTPLYRSFIGSDHLATLIEAANRAEKQSSYPPYNIELLSEYKYRIAKQRTYKIATKAASRSIVTINGTTYSPDKTTNTGDTNGPNA